MNLPANRTWIAFAGGLVVGAAVPAMAARPHRGEVVTERLVIRGPSGGDSIVLDTDTEGNGRIRVNTSDAPRRDVECDWPASNVEVNSLRVFDPSGSGASGSFSATDASTALILVDAQQEIRLVVDESSASVRVRSDDASASLEASSSGARLVLTHGDETWTFPP